MDGELYWAEGMSVDVFHGDAIIVSLSKRAVISNDIGVIEALWENLCLFFDRLYFPTIILAVKFELYLHNWCFTFFTAKKEPFMSTFSTFPKEPAPMHPKTFIYNIYWLVPNLTNNIYRLFLLRLIIFDEEPSCFSIIKQCIDW